MRFKRFRRRPTAAQRQATLRGLAEQEGRIPASVRSNIRALANSLAQAEHEVERCEELLIELRRENRQLFEALVALDTAVEDVLLHRGGGALGHLDEVRGAIWASYGAVSAMLKDRQSTERRMLKDPAEGR